MSIQNSATSRKQHSAPSAVNGNEARLVSASPRIGTTVPPEQELAQEYLEARGCSLEAFLRSGCEVVASLNRLDPIFPATPGLVFNFCDPQTGEPLTFTDQRGQKRLFQRVRPLGTRGAKFLQPRASGTRVFFARHPNVNWSEVVRDTEYGLVLSEGETRSLAGAIHDLAVIAITGVDCGQVDGKLHPDLAAVTWRGRDVYMAFDSDVQRKSGPRTALERLAGLLRQQGARVLETRIPPSSDGSKQGLDDFLARYGAGEFKALLSSPETFPMPGAEVYEPPVSLRDLLAAAYPPTEWVWDNFVLKGEVNLLFGDGGVGKSLLSLYLAVHVAANKPLFGNAVAPLPVIGLFAEDAAAQVQQRINTILINAGLDAQGDLPIKLWCQPRGEIALAQIDDAGTVTELPRLHALRSELAATGSPALLVLDSLADLFALNESVRLPVNAALKQVLGGLCRDYGATVLVLAHPSKTSMEDGTHYSGSTAFNNAVRQRLTLALAKHESGAFAEGAPPRTLSVAKSNYGAQGAKELWFYGATIETLPRAMPDDGRAVQARKIVVTAAIDAALRSAPLNRNRTPPDIVFRDIEKAAGRRPSRHEIRNALEEALRLGELTYVSHTRHRASGFYPPEPEVALDLAKATARKLKASKRRDSDAP